jgi:ribosomal protein L7Ae-like RNA K-turn-binding protein
MGLLGLGLRAGTLAVGVEGVRGGLQRDEFWCVVLASDASARAVDKVVALARAKDIPIVAGPPSDRVGLKLGRPPVMVVGVRDRSLADGILRLGGTPD